MSGEESWRLNYFNYFTEVEEHFQRARATSLFLLSPLDWALVESWKNAGIPLEAVLRGIDAAFVKWHTRKVKTQLVNSIAYCAQAVMLEAQAMAQSVDSRPASQTAESPFPSGAVRKFLEDAAAALRRHVRPAYHEMAASLETILGGLEAHLANLEALDQRLTALEDKMAAIARTQLSDDDLFEFRRQLDLQLRPYRSKMTGDQIARLEKSYLDRMVFERAGLPRLSLFFIK
jgi:hypothetical protein